MAVSGKHRVAGCMDQTLCEAHGREARHDHHRLPGIRTLAGVTSVGRRQGPLPQAVTCLDILLPPNFFVQGIPEISDLVIPRIHDSVIL